MPTYRTTNWCFTWNNYNEALFNMDTVEEIVRYTFGDFKYICLGFEVGKQGTPHIQGYIDFKDKVSLTPLKRIDRKINWSGRKGTWKQATDYCKKDGKFIEFGKPNKQGERTDLNEIKESIAKGEKTVDEITMEHPMIFHQYGRTLNKIEDIALRKKFRTTMTEGFWYYGPTAVGKSHKAFTGFNPDTHYVYPNDNGWWDGYTQQETVILNDFRGEIPYNMLLQLIDKWPMTVRRRNREPMPFTSKRIIITSSVRPESVYKQTNKKDNIAQLLRRLKVEEIPAVSEVPQSKVPGSGQGNTLPDHSLSLYIEKVALYIDELEEQKMINKIKELPMQEYEEF